MTRCVWNAARLALVNTVQINKTADRMYALLALCNTLAPTRLDDNVMNAVREKYGDQMSRMARGWVLSRWTLPVLTHVQRRRPKHI